MSTIISRSLLALLTGLVSAPINAQTAPEPPRSQAPASPGKAPQSAGALPAGKSTRPCRDEHFNIANSIIVPQSNGMSMIYGEIRFSMGMMGAGGGTPSGPVALFAFTQVRGADLAGYKVVNKNVSEGRLLRLTKAADDPVDRDALARAVYFCTVAEAISDEELKAKFLKK